VRRLPATTVYYGLEFVLSMPSYILIAVYLVRDLNLSPLELILVGTVMEATVFVTEVPTGILADTYSRRLSLIVSFVIQGAAIVLITSVPHIAVVLLAWGLWGFGYTFMSGAYEAWITDEVGAENVGPVFMRGNRISYAGAFVGLMLGVTLATQSLRGAVIAGGVLTALAGVACIFVMPETGFRRRPVGERGGPFHEFRTTAVNATRFVRAQPMLLLLIAVAFFAGMSTETFDRLQEAHFIRDIGLPKIGSLDPVVWFGLFGAGGLLIAFFASGTLVKRFEHAGIATIVKLLFGLTCVMMIGQIVFGLAGGIAVAIAAVFATSLARSLVYPLYMTWLNQQITDSSIRATVISMNGQSDAIGQAGGGPLLGAIGNAWGIRVALVAGGLVLAPVLALYGRALARGGNAPELHELPEPALQP